MKTITINENELSDNQIDKRNSKSRAVLVSGDKILVAYYGGVYLLPGGSIDKGEEEKQAIIRELKEETGMTYKDEELRKMMLLEHYQPNYPTRGGETINRLITTHFYLGRFKGIDLEKTERTEKEKKDDFRLELLNYDEILRRVRSQKDNSNPRKPYFDQELIEVINTYKKLMNLEQNKRETIDEREQ